MNYKSSNTVTVYQIDNQWHFNAIDETNPQPLTNEFGNLLIPFIPNYAHPNGNMVIHLCNYKLSFSAYQLTWVESHDDEETDVYKIKNTFNKKCNTSTDDKIHIPHSLIYIDYTSKLNIDVKIIPDDIFITFCIKEQFPAKAFSI